MPTVLLVIDVGDRATADAPAETRRAVAGRILGRRAEILVRSDLTDEQLRAALQRVDVVLISGFPRDLPEDAWRKMTRLRMIQTLLAGVDHLPYELFPKGVTICSNAGAFRVSIPEHAFALLLAAAKHIAVHDAAIRAGQFDQSRIGTALHGKTVAIIGLGGIGAGVAARAKGFGMRVVGINRSGKADAPVDACGTMRDLERALRDSDFVVLALPLTKDTVGLIGRRELGWMKPNAVLVNVARGKLVREDDLYEHLRAHPQFRAALDVWWRYPKTRGERPFARPFHDLPNVVMTPHVSWAVPEQAVWSLEAACENIARFLDGQPPRNAVDPKEYAFPSEGNSVDNL